MVIVIMLPSLGLIIPCLLCIYSVQGHAVVSILHDHHARSAGFLCLCHLKFLHTPLSYYSNSDATFSSGEKNPSKHKKLVPPVSKNIDFDFFKNFTNKLPNLGLWAPKTDSACDLLAIRQKFIQKFALAATFWAKISFSKSSHFQSGCFERASSVMGTGFSVH